jgi:hypothetical protein
MAKLLCATAVLLIFIGLPDLAGAAVRVVTASRCDPYAEAVKQGLAALPAPPRDWTVVVFCTQPEWDAVRRRADAFRTNTAFTNAEAAYTYLNGPLLATRPVELRRVLQHEREHVRCRCDLREGN